ncbi:hypothetical protein [Enterococcus sp. DIV0240a]|uniref:hypothetical protein n=1 Tax=Enterococcus sp. DIV0240a TaxID=2774651 RepID=UPI003D29CCEC
MDIKEIHKLTNDQIMEQICNLTFNSSWMEYPEVVNEVRKFGEVVWERTILKQREMGGNRNGVYVKVIFPDNCTKIFMSIKGAARELKVSINTIRSYLDSGKTDKVGRLYQKI